MDANLTAVINHIGEEYRDRIDRGSRHYVEIDIGKKAESLGFLQLKKAFGKVNAVVPLKQPTGGMKVRIDGRTFVHYAEYETGVVVPGYVARESGLPYRTFVPQDSMILNFV